MCSKWLLWPILERAGSFILEAAGQYWLPIQKTDLGRYRRKISRMY